MAERRIAPVITELSYAGDPSPERFDPFITMFEQGPTMVTKAREMTKQAVSYRMKKLPVGATALTHNYAEQKLRVYGGFNYKPSKESPTDCAEMRAVGGGKASNFLGREAIFAAGPTDTEQIRSVIDVPYALLPPCHRCVKLTEDSTVLMYFGNNEDIFGVQTGQSIREIHPVLNPLAKKERAEDHPFVQQPIYDLSSLSWEAASETYKEITAEVDPTTFSSISDLRMVRAAAVIMAISSNAKPA